MNLLEVNGISKTYGVGETAVHALKNVNFSVPKGEFAAVVSKKYEQTIIMITHSRSIAQMADHILQVSDGELTDLGRCRE